MGNRAATATPSTTATTAAGPTVDKRAARKAGHQATDDKGKEILDDGGRLAFDHKRPTLAAEAKALLTRVTTGTLCTAQSDAGGHPFGSLVAYVVDPDTSDVLLVISKMAEHTENLSKDDRASLFVQEPAMGPGGRGEELAKARLTLMGRVAFVDKTEERIKAFLAVHPSAAGYIHFTDFLCAKLTPMRARYVAGFGRMGWIEGVPDFTKEPRDPVMWAPETLYAVKHLNEDHAADMALLVEQLPSHAHGTNGEQKEQDKLESVKVARIDRFGIDVVGKAAGSGVRRTARVPFPEPGLGDPSELRAVVTKMVKQAKGKPVDGDAQDLAHDQGEHATSTASATATEEKQA